MRSLKKYNYLFFHNFVILIYSFFLFDLEIREVQTQLLVGTPGLELRSEELLLGKEFYLNLPLKQKVVFLLETGTKTIFINLCFRTSRKRLSSNALAR